MIHALLVLALILLVVWFLFHAAGGLVNLIWLVIIVLVVIWLFGLLRGAPRAETGLVAGIRLAQHTVHCR